MDDFDTENTQYLEAEIVKAVSTDDDDNTLPDIHVIKEDTSISDEDN